MRLPRASASAPTTAATTNAGATRTRLSSVYGAVVGSASIARRSAAPVAVATTTAPTPIHGGRTA